MSLSGKPTHKIYSRAHWVIRISTGKYHFVPSQVDKLVKYDAICFRRWARQTFRIVGLKNENTARGWNGCVFCIMFT